MKERKDIGKILKGDVKVIEKRSEILEKICVALNANDVGTMPKLVESALDIGCTAEEIKKVIRNNMARPDFDVICEFCRAMRFEEDRMEVKNG